MAAEVVMYGTRSCPYCIRARDLLRRKGVAYRDVDVTADPAARAELAQRTGRSTVPQVFINGRSVGGFDDIAALDRRGELDRMLAETRTPAP